MSEMKYTEAHDELQEIILEIQNGDISPDELAVKVRRAAELIKFCKHKLTTTEEDVNQILKELEE